MFKTISRLFTKKRAAPKPISFAEILRTKPNEFAPKGNREESPRSGNHPMLEK